MKLLTIANDPKTIKGQKFGYMTAIMYLAPFRASGHQVCPMADIAGCWQTCLNTAGRGGMAAHETTINGMRIPDNAIQRARIARTRFFIERKAEFLEQLAREIGAFTRKAARRALTPAIRLNGTSDIQWERTGIIDRFPQTQFYDYTKIIKRVAAARHHPNYHLTLSYSEADALYAKRCLKAHREGASLAVVTTDKSAWLNRGATDMDETDLRFLDPPGTIGVLVAKGRAKQETNGFVLGGEARWLKNCLYRPTHDIPGLQLAS